jgi:hypothetical protein
MDETNTTFYFAITMIVVWIIVFLIAVTFASNSL